MNTSQAAEYLGVNDSRIRQLCRSGELEGMRVGRDWVIERQTLDQFKATRIQQVEDRRGKPGRPPKV